MYTQGNVATTQLLLDQVTNLVFTRIVKDCCTPLHSAKYGAETH